jgi:ubiquinone/menaquinone biosynthesis C-methylase UbiE
MNDRLYMALLSAKKPPRNILDIATGVGDWAIQMGDLFPDSTVIGTDLSPIQPNDASERLLLCRRFVSVFLSITWHI